MYSPAQRRIIAHRGGHLQVVACAGSGKTETVAMRVATLVAEGVPPDAIVAFTFTNAAADALKARILRKVEQVAPDLPLDRLSPLFVGTIHSFCLRFLQERVPRYATFDLFDENRLVGLLSREYFNLGLDRLPGHPRRTAVIDAFLETASVVDNEMLDLAALPPGDFKDACVAYLDLLDRYHVLTHDQCIARAVQELEAADAAQPLRARLRHLVVDEFQDINPAQAKLIELLGRKPVQVCVVGDDDQAIYQWRGSSVDYIRKFKTRFRATRETLKTNRRSSAGIVRLAGAFAKSLPKRLPDKPIRAHRTADRNDVQRFVVPTAADEADVIADAVARMRDDGIPLRDIAVLLRSVRTAGPVFLAAFDGRGIRARCVGRRSLFYETEPEVIAKVYAFLAGRPSFWNARHRRADPVGLDDLVPDLVRTFDLPPKKAKSVRAHLAAFPAAIAKAREADLVGSLYRLLRLLDVHLWDVDDADQVRRLGSLARFSQVLADFESVTRRARRIDGEGMRGGLARGEKLLERLVDYLSFYAQTEYDGFAGEPDFDEDAVTVSTIHGAKGLEWPVVFVPSLSAQRFPTSRTGRPKDWLIPRDLFPAARYEGDDADERRLFYVAMTRARDVLYLSTHERVTTRRTKPSPYFEEVGGRGLSPSTRRLWTPRSLPARTAGEDAKPTFAFSELAFFYTCPLSYRLRLNLGFQPTAATELGYGKAVHHVLRRVAELVREKKRRLRQAEIERIFDEEFYLPYADRPAYEMMRGKAQRLVGEYVADHGDDLERVWEVERPFELHLPEASVVGRADVILETADGQPSGLALIDYKTRQDPAREPLYHLQLRIYAAAARGEGHDVRAAWLHDLTATRGAGRQAVSVADAAVAGARTEASRMVSGVRERRFGATVGPHCKGCDVRLVCRHGPET